MTTMNAGEPFSLSRTDINLVDHISEALSSHGTWWEFPPE
jgi:hypothetical protein